MYVQFVERALAIVVAHRVLHGTGAVVDAVNEQVLVEQRYGPRDGRFVDCLQRRFHIRKAKRLRVFYHRLEYQQAYRRRFDASTYQFFFKFLHVAVP